MEDEPTGHLLAVMAHSMLNSVAAFKSATSMLEQRDRLNDRQIDAIIGVLGSQAEHLHEMLKDLVRTGDPALMSTLDDLDRRAHYRIEGRGSHGPEF